MRRCSFAGSSDKRARNSAVSAMSNNLESALLDVGGSSLQASEERFIGADFRHLSFVCELHLLEEAESGCFHEVGNWPIIGLSRGSDSLILLFTKPDRDDLGHIYRIHLNTNEAKSASGQRIKAQCIVALLEQARAL